MRLELRNANRRDQPVPRQGKIQNGRERNPVAKKRGKNVSKISIFTVLSLSHKWTLDILNLLKRIGIGRFQARSLLITELELSNLEAIYPTIVVIDIYRNYSYKAALKDLRPIKPIEMHKNSRFQARSLLLAKLKLSNLLAICLITALTLCVS